MTHSPLSVANKIIQIKDSPLTIMELLKLQYIAHGYSLAILDKPLFSGKIEAWPYGPVIREVYRAFKKTQGIYIKTPIEGISSDIDQTSEKILTEVLNIYKDKDGWELSALTHEESSPWTEIVSSSGFYSEIPDQLTKAYYKKLIGQ